MDPTSEKREERWEKEVKFFDEWADRSAQSVRPIDPLAVRRYSSPRLRRRFSKEYRFRVLGSLDGKQVLDVGCGDGMNGRWKRPRSVSWQVIFPICVSSRSRCWAGWIDLFSTR